MSTSAGSPADVPGETKTGDASSDSVDLETAAACWSARSRMPSTGANWWEHDRIVRHVNRLICGEEVRGIAGGDVAVLAKRGLEMGVSVGCGLANKEIALLASGAVEHFHLYEIAEERLERAQQAAARHGLSARITWHREPADFAVPLKVDLVYWNNALHHMPDTERAVAWSRASLRPGGVFYMNDFVGPDRMQWPPEMLRIASAIRALLPDRLIGDAPRHVEPPDPDALQAADPTECADSAAILPAVQRHFPDTTITLTGGVVYHLALKGLLERFTDADDDLLAWLLRADELCVRRGLTHYAVAFAGNGDATPERASAPP